jgi:hypothetical protein
MVAAPSLKKLARQAIIVFLQFHQLRVVRELPGREVGLSHLGTAVALRLVPIFYGDGTEKCPATGQ